MTRTLGARPRHLVGAARRFPLLIALAALAACAPATPGSAAPTPAPSSPASTAIVSSTAPTAAATASSADRITAAMDAMAAGYTYTATVAVGSATVSTAKGRSVGGSSEFQLTTGGKTVTYRAIPPKAWVQQPGGAWVAVSGQVPQGSPIAGLAAPSSATVVSDDASGLAVDATYPPAALGLTGSTPQRVHLLLAPDGTITVSYDTAIGGSAASSTSVFSPASGLAPITAPSS